MTYDIPKEKFKYTNSTKKIVNFFKIIESKFKTIINAFLKY